MNIDNAYLTGTLQDLIRINSINPVLVAGSPGETEIADYVASALRKLDLDVKLCQAQPGRVSVIGRLPGKGQGRSLMLNAHLDTVGVEGMAAPFAAEVRDGKMYGRGAYDMKGSLAACLTALKALVEENIALNGDVVLAAVADEEHASLGTAEVIEQIKVDAAIVTEATELQLCVAHKGFIWLEVETFGRAAHGSRFAEGIDANMRMGRFLARLERLEHDLRGRIGHAVVGPPSLHAAMLQGGSGLSTYAANCKLFIERRTIPGETEAQVLREVQTIITHLTAEDPKYRATAKAILARAPFEVSPQADLVKILAETATPILGKPPRHIGQSFWMDSALLAAAGIETVVIGPVGAGAHAAVEWVDLKSLAVLAQILAQTAVAYCR